MIFGAILLALGAGIVGYVAYSYMTAPKTITINSLKPEDPPITRPSTTMDKLAYSTKRSASLFVQLAITASSAVGIGILNMSDFLMGPEVRQWVTLNMSPEVAAGAFVIFAGISAIARIRTMFATTS